MERNFAWIFGLIGSIIIFMIYTQFGLTPKFDTILGSAVTFSSIMIGFVGVLMGILFSIRNTELIDKFFNTVGRETLKHYFKQSIISGILLVICSMLMYLRDGFNSLLGIGILLWAFLLIFMFFSTYRIINIVTYMIFDDGNYYDSEQEAIKMDNEERKQLEKSYSRKK